MLGIHRLRLGQPKTKKPVIELTWDNRFGRWLWKRGWAAVTTNLPFFYIISYWLMPEAAVDPYTRVHEFQHVAQGDRDRFFLVNWIHYLWDARHGYWHNPLEAEAYQVADAAAQNGLPDWAR